MSFIPYRAIDEFSAAAPDTDAARAAERAMCRLRALNPQIFDYAYALSPAGQPLFPDANRYMWNTVCDRHESPPLPQASEYFYGGQCPVQYFIVGELYFNDRPGYSGTALISVFGPIQTLRWERTYNATTEQYDWFMFWRGADGNLLSAGMGSDSRENVQNRRPIIKIRRSDGLPDDCGNIPPPTPVVPPVFSPSIDLDVELWGVNRPVTFVFPRIDTRDPENPEFLPIVTFEGVVAEFYVDGINITFPPNFTLPTRPEIRFPEDRTDEIINAGSNNLTTLINYLNQQFENIQNGTEIDIQPIIDKIERCCCKKGVYYDVVNVVSGTSGGRFSLPENTVAAIVGITNQFTPETRVQVGAGSAPTVYHWGSVSVCDSFSVGGERIPLQWSYQIIDCPRYATNVIVWPTQQNLADVYAVVEMEEE